MQLKYVDTKEEIIAVNKKSKHIEPHLHNALEIVCVTNGALELGVGQELYHMEKGDIGFVFPDVIHHYQVLTPGVNTAIYLIASPFVISKFADIMQSMAPEYPIIRAEKVEQEVYRVINAILETEQPDITVIVWKIRGILLQIFVWIVDLKVKERLTEHLKKDTKYRRVTIGVNA